VIKILQKMPFIHSDIYRHNSFKFFNSFTMSIHEFANSTFDKFNINYLIDSPLGAIMLFLLRMCVIATLSHPIGSEESHVTDNFVDDVALGCP